MVASWYNSAICQPIAIAVVTAGTPAGRDADWVCSADPGSGALAIDDSMLHLNASHGLILVSSRGWCSINIQGLFIGSVERIWSPMWIGNTCSTTSQLGGILRVRRL